jgi:putrescine aminotransferase
LREAFDGHPIVGEVAGTGLVAGVQLAREPRSRTRFADGSEIGIVCRDFCFDANLIMRASGDRMLLSPPLVVTHAQIDEIVEKAKRAVDATARQVGMS